MHDWPCCKGNIKNYADGMMWRKCCKCLLTDKNQSSKVKQDDPILAYFLIKAMRSAFSVF